MRKQCLRGLLRQHRHIGAEEGSQGFVASSRRTMAVSQGFVTSASERRSGQEAHAVFSLGFSCQYSFFLRRTTEEQSFFIQQHQGFKPVSSLWRDLICVSRRPVVGASASQVLQFWFRLYTNALWSGGIFGVYKAVSIRSDNASRRGSSWTRRELQTGSSAPLVDPRAQFSQTAFYWSWTEGDASTSIVGIAMFSSASFDFPLLSLRRFSGFGCDA